MRLIMFKDICFYMFERSLLFFDLINNLSNFLKKATLSTKLNETFMTPFP